MDGMEPEPRNVQTVYLVLTLCTTLARSLSWGIHSLFLPAAALRLTPPLRDARRLLHLGDQPPVPARRRAEQHRRIRRQRVLHGRHGPVRGADRGGRRHLGPPRLLPARSEE